MFLLYSGICLGQQGINYKAIISDNGAVIQNQQVDISFTILESGTTTIYKELHVLNTDSNGLVIANIGEGITTIGNFATLDWSQEYFLNVEVDAGNGTVDMGTTAFKNVPYALHAKTATTITGPIPNVGNLVKITEGSNTGYRLVDANVNNYGDIGRNALDLSIQSNESSITGATGNYTFASGRQTTASGNYSTAMGYNTVASGDYSVALGSDTEATDGFSTALGLNSAASGFISTAMGSNTAASEDYSTAMGNRTSASGESSTAMGDYTSASGESSTAMGSYTTASGRFSTAIGSSTTASGDYSLAIGKTMQAVGENSIAFGTQGYANGNNSFAAGLSSIANGFVSFTMGAYSISDGNFSTSMGVVTTAESYGQSTFGIHNTDASGTVDSFVATDRLFVIGNGTSTSSRSDAMVILKNGNTTINGNLDVNGDFEEVNATDSGDADMKAYIYGLITGSSGVIKSASSDGFTVTRNSTGSYSVIFNNSPSSYQDYMVVSSLHGTIGFIKTVRNTPHIAVTTYNTSGVVADSDFNFVVYKK